jgi:putative transposase
MAIAATYKGYRYPIEVIERAVWLYHRFALSLRDVEELMLARGHRTPISQPESGNG